MSWGGSQSEKKDVDNLANLLFCFFSSFTAIHYAIEISSIDPHPSVHILHKEQTVNSHLIYS